MKETKLYSGFPGTGKSYFFKYSEGVVLDSDSSNFDKEHFPQNYIDHIKNNIGVADIICISSHKEVRDALLENGLEFTLIYPDISLKEEYLQRYLDRGSPQGFIDLISNNWDSWVGELPNQQGCEHLVLNESQFISDIIE